MGLTEDILRESQRGRILQILMTVFPEAVSFSDLYASMVRQGSTIKNFQALAFHIGYLKDRGYVRLEKLRSGRADIELNLVRLTAHGVDLLDRRILPDPGVAF